MLLIELCEAHRVKNKVEKERPVVEDGWRDLEIKTEIQARNYRD